MTKDETDRLQAALIAIVPMELKRWLRAPQNSKCLNLRQGEEFDQRRLPDLPFAPDNFDAL